MRSASYDPRCIMLNRHPLPQGVEDLIGIKAAWKVAYRSWRSQQRITAFPSGMVVMSTKHDPSNFDCEMDWFR